MSDPTKDCGACEQIAKYGYANESHTCMLHKPAPACEYCAAKDPISHVDGRQVYHVTPLHTFYRCTATDQEKQPAAKARRRVEPGFVIQPDDEEQPEPCPACACKSDVCTHQHTNDQEKQPTVEPEPACERCGRPLMRPSAAGHGFHVDGSCCQPLNRGAEEFAAGTR